MLLENTVKRCAEELWVEIETFDEIEIPTKKSVDAPLSKGDNLN